MKMGKFAILGIFMAVIFGFFHIMFIMMDYGFNDPEKGAFVRVQNVLNDTLSSKYQNWTNNGTVMMRQFFGVGRVVILGVIIVCFTMEIMESRKVEG